MNFICIFSNIILMVEEEMVQYFAIHIESSVFYRTKFKC